MNALRDSNSTNQRTERRRKRVLTDARKEQNRVASKAYRQRQRELLQNIQHRNKDCSGIQRRLKPRRPYGASENSRVVVSQQAILDVQSADLLSTTAPCLNDVSPQQGSLQPPVTADRMPDIDSNQNENLGSPEVFSLLPPVDLTIPSYDPSPTTEPATSDSLPFPTSFLEPTEFENPDPGNLSYASHYLDMPFGGVVSESLGMFDDLIPETTYSAPPPSIHMDSLQVSNFRQPYSYDIPQVNFQEYPGSQLSVDVPVDQNSDYVGLSSERSEFMLDHQVQNETSDSLTPASLPDPYMNYIQLSQVATLNAVLRNAVCLGINLQELMTAKFCSPFYRTTSAADDPKALLAAASIPTIPGHLQPTLPQILFRHHTLLDLLPFPVLRARAVALGATAPHLFNPLDLKRDIIEGGLICWRSKNGNNLGNGQPWDMRSWEAAPWFLKKWRMLIGGEDGPIWKQSVQWQNIRACQSVGYS